MRERSPIGILALLALPTIACASLLDLGPVDFEARSDGGTPRDDAGSTSGLDGAPREDARADAFAEGVPDAAPGTFCATQPGRVLCSDFEVALPGPWSSRIVNSGARAEIVSVDGTANVLRLATGTNGSCLRSQLPLGLVRLSAELSVRIFTSGSGQADVFGVSSEDDLEEIWVDVRSNGELVFDNEANDDGNVEPIGRSIDGSWHRLRLEIEPRTGDSLVRLLVDGQLAKETTTLAKAFRGRPYFAVGDCDASESSSYELDIDDVSVEAD